MGLFSDILLTVDYDRTLTAPDSTVPAQNIAAITYFMENGGHFTVNTGRSIPMCVNTVIPTVPVNAPLLLYNGSAAYDVATGKLTRYAPLPENGLEMVADLRQRFPSLHLEIQGLQAHYLTIPDAGWEAYSRHNRCAYDYVSLENIPQPFIKASLYGQFRENTVAGMYQATQEDLELFDEAMDYINRTYGDGVQVFRSCPRIADIHAKGVSKLQSARLLQKELGCKILVCVGDAENDIAMLDGADYAYCPADGIVADRYENVAACAEGAIADVIYKKIPLIIQKQP